MQKTEMTINRNLEAVQIIKAIERKYREIRKLTSQLNKTRLLTVETKEVFDDDEKLVNITLKGFKEI